jgi:glutathionyl-hydroquinone reductase
LQFAVRPIRGRTAICFIYIKRHDYMTHDQPNPTRIVPAAPLVDWTAPHGREALA